jgi:CheY-like chemotaxis protein
MLWKKETELNGIKILVVDDDNEVRVVFQKMLQSEGYEVKAVENALKKQTRSQMLENTAHELEAL